jgi:hypothetical protein
MKDVVNLIKFEALVGKIKGKNWKVGKLVEM